MPENTKSIFSFLIIKPQEKMILYISNNCRHLQEDEYFGEKCNIKIISGI